MADTPANPRHRWLQFSLRTLFVAVTVAAIALALWSRARRLQVRSEEHLSMASSLFIESEEERYEGRHAQSTCLGLAACRHLVLAGTCEQAAWRPWTLYWPDPADLDLEDPPGSQADRP